MAYSDEQRLRMLRSTDNWRMWHSLDDERLCIQCTQLITGREVIVTVGEGGRWTVSCPTPGCNSTPRDWFYHGKRRSDALANIVQIP